MAEGPISWLVIDEYCDRKGLEGEQREDMFHYVQTLDHAYLEHRTAKVKASGKKGK